MSTRGITKPKRSQTMVINDPDKPRRVFTPSEEAVKLSKDKIAVELVHEERELDDAVKEVWDE